MERAIARPGGFAALESGRQAAIIAGDGQQRVRLPGFVLASGQGELLLEVPDLLRDPRAIKPGTDVVVLDGESSEAAWVAWSDTRGLPLVMLKAFSAQDDTENRRRARRIANGVIHAHVSLVTGFGASRFRVHVLDLSGTGARVLCPRSLPKGAELVLHLPPLEGHEAVNMRVKPVWVRPAHRSFLVGLQFNESPEGLAQVQRLVFQLRWKRVIP